MKRDHRFFERWCQRMNMRAVGRFNTDRDGNDLPADILIADSGEPFYGANAEGIVGRWYRTAYAIDRGDTTWLASFHDHNAVEFDLVSLETGFKRRVDECFDAAVDTLRKTDAAGLYDHGRRESFSKRPH
jgi:hypothetical protein